MVHINHSLKFVTELNELHPTAQRFLELEAEAQVEMLEKMLHELLLPVVQPEVDRINENGSWAILKVAN